VGGDEPRPYISSPRNDERDVGAESNDNISRFGGLTLYYSIYRVFYPVREILNLEKTIDSARRWGV